MTLPCDLMPIFCVFVLHYKNYANNLEINDDTQSNYLTDPISEYYSTIKESTVSSRQYERKTSKGMENSYHSSHNNDYLLTKEDCE